MRNWRDSRWANVAFLAAVFLLPFLTQCGCVSPFGHGGAAPATGGLWERFTHPRGSAAGSTALDLGMIAGIVLIVVGVVMAAAALSKGLSPRPGGALAGAGAAIWLLMEFFQQYSGILLLLAFLSLVGFVAWEILTHRKQIEDKARRAGLNLPGLAGGTG